MAAALFPLFAFVYFFTRPGDKEATKTSITKPAVLTPAPMNVLARSQAIVLEEKPEVNRKKQGTVKLHELHLKAVDTTKMEAPENIAQISEPENETAAVAASAPSKPKFRIVHINELNSEPGSSAASATSPDFKKPFLASVTTLRGGDENKIVQKKKYPLSFLSNAIQ
jgi:hypothetical protein